MFCRSSKVMPLTQDSRPAVALSLAAIEFSVEATSMPSSASGAGVESHDGSMHGLSDSGSCSTVIVESVFASALSAVQLSENSAASPSATSDELKVGSISLESHYCGSGAMAARYLRQHDAGFFSQQRRRRQLKPISQAPKTNQKHKLKGLSQRDSAEQSKIDYFRTLRDYWYDSKNYIHKVKLLNNELSTFLWQIKKTLSVPNRHLLKKYQDDFTLCQLDRLVSSLNPEHELIVAFDWDKTLFFEQTDFSALIEYFQMLFSCVEDKVMIIILTARMAVMPEAQLECPWVLDHLTIINSNNMFPKFAICQHLAKETRRHVILVDDSPLEFNYAKRVLGLEHTVTDQIIEDSVTFEDTTENKQVIFMFAECLSELFKLVPYDSFYDNVFFRALEEEILRLCPSLSDEQSSAAGKSFKH